MYYATLTGSVLDLLDLDRVEILRGPQGTLAGRNSIGGSVKLYSQKPSADTSGSFGVTYGTRNRIDLRGMVNFALADNLFLRVSGVDRSQDGYVERRRLRLREPGQSLRHPVADRLAARLRRRQRQQRELHARARAQLRWLPSDALELNLAADYTTDKRNPTGVVLVDYRALPAWNLANIQAVVDTNPANNAPGTAFVTPAGSYYNYASYYSPNAPFNGNPGPPGIIQGAYDTSFNGTRLSNYPMAETRPSQASSSTAGVPR